MKTATLIALISATLCLPALAGADDEARMKTAREKEMSRAAETAEDVSVGKRFEEKYGWAKEDFPAQYRKLEEKRREAERAWKEAAGHIARARDTTTSTPPRFRPIRPRPWPTSRKWNSRPRAQSGIG